MHSLNENLVIVCDNPRPTFNVVTTRFYCAAGIFHQKSSVLLKLLNDFNSNFAFRTSLCFLELGLSSVHERTECDVPGIVSDPLTAAEQDILSIHFCVSSCEAA